MVTIYNTTFINQTTQITSVEDNADSAVLTVAPNKYAAWTGQGYYGATPVPIPDVRCYVLFIHLRHNNVHLVSSIFRNGAARISERTISILRTERCVLTNFSFEH